MFDGKIGSRVVNFSGNRRESEKKTAKALSEESKRQRELRAQQKVLTDAAVRIQKIIRMRLAGRKSKSAFRGLVDKKLSDIRNYKAVFAAKGAKFNVPVAVIDSIIQTFLFFYSSLEDSHRLSLLVDLMLESVNQPNADFNYLFNLESTSKWDKFVKKYENLKLYRLVKLCTLLIRSGLVSNEKFVQFLSLATQVSPTDSQVTGSFVKVLLCCLLCEEAVRGLQQAVSSDEIKCLMNVAQVCICCPEFLSRTDNWSYISTCRERVLKSVCLLLLSVPSVSSHVLLSSVLSMLTQPQYLNWTSFMQELCAQSNSHFSIHLVGNILSLLSSDKVASSDSLNFLFSGSLLASLSDLLSAGNASLGHSVSNGNVLPLLLLLRNVDQIERATHFSVAEIEEAVREYSLSAGHRKLEYRLFAYQQQLCRKTSDRLADVANTNSLREILKFLSGRGEVLQLFDRLTRATTALELVDVLPISSVYAQILLYCPASTPLNTAAAIVGEKASKALLNSIIFNATAGGQDNVVVRLWKLIVSQFQTILPLITTNFVNSFQEAVNTYNGQAIAESSSWYAFFALAGTLRLTPIELLRQVSLLLFLFCSVFTAQLAVMDDTELLSAVPAEMMQEIVLLLKGWLHNMYWLEPVFDDSKVSFQDMLRGVEVGNPPVTPVNKYGLNMNPTATAPPVLSHKYLFLVRSQCQMAATRLFQQLCYRNERHPYMTPACYQWPPLSQSDLVIVDPTATVDSASSNDSEVDSNVGSMIAKNPKVMNVLTFIPQVMHFEQRVYIFQQLLDHDKIHYHGGNLRAMMGFSNAVSVTLRRNNLLQDAFATLNRIGHKLKGRIKIEFVSPQGYVEAGIDGGGLFKEFLDSFCKAVFTPSQDDSSRAFFVPTFQQLLTINPEIAAVGKQVASVGDASPSGSAGSEESQAMEVVVDGGEQAQTNQDEEEEVDDGIERITRLQYSDKGARSAVGASNLEYYHFIGKILGKACYDRLLLESEFSGGLLNILLGRSNQLDDLAYLDEELYRNLRTLKKIANEGGDIEALDLYFVASRHNSDGSLVSVDLIPNGSNTLVTRATVHQYIHLLANYKQNVQIADAARALVSGFRSVVPLEWIRMFSGVELQKLISGERQRINLADLKMHCNYSSGYAENTPYMQGFWRIIEEMSLEDQGHFLRFVTSCSRQPLLGFKMLNPLFCIQRVPAYDLTEGVEYDEQGNVNLEKSGKLPTAATCMNLLKLPFYDNNFAVLKKKLLYAIRSNSGFELS